MWSNKVEIPAVRVVYPGAAPCGSDVEGVVALDRAVVDPDALGMRLDSDRLDDQPRPRPRQDRRADPEVAHRAERCPTRYACVRSYNPHTPSLGDPWRVDT